MSSTGAPPANLRGGSHKNDQAFSPGDDKYLIDLQGYLMV